ncbi:MAG TPA: EthD family reductase [Rhizobiaceae bacterium]|nr:EthD family reductase [Rhizobiaceae bacterium]
MARIVALYMTPKDRDAFDRYYHATHVPLAKKLPGLREYDISQGPIQTASGPADVHLVATLTFDSVQAIESALGSAEGKAVAADLGKFADGGVELYIFDTREI